IARKQSRKPAKSKPIRRSIVRIASVRRSGGGETAGGRLDVMSGHLYRADLIDSRGAQPECGGVTGDPRGARALRVAAAQDRVLFVERLDVLVDVTGAGGEAERDHVEG